MAQTPERGTPPTSGGGESPLSDTHNPLVNQGFSESSSAPWSVRGQLWRCGAHRELGGDVPRAEALLYPPDASNHSDMYFQLSPGSWISWLLIIMTGRRGAMSNSSFV